MISYLLFFPHFLTRGHVTSAIRQPHILLFIYVNRPRSILGRPVVSSFDDLKFLFCPFPIWSTLGQFPTFASDFTRSNSWEFVPLALCVGVLCFRVTNVDVCIWRWGLAKKQKNHKLINLCHLLSHCTWSFVIRSCQLLSEWNVTFCLDSI